MKKIILFSIMIIIYFNYQTINAEEVNIYNDILDVLSREEINPENVIELIIINVSRNNEIFIKTEEEMISFEWIGENDLNDYSSLSQFTNLTYLNIRDLAYEIILPSMDNLKVLQLYTKHSNLGIIGHNFKCLEELYITSDDKVDFEMIKKLKNLQKLGLNGMSVTNLTTEYYPNSLEVLDLSDTQIELNEYFTLYSNNTVESIIISDMNVNILEFISNNKSLKELSLTYIKDLDMDIIKNLNLNQLNIVYCTIYNDNFEYLNTIRLNISNNINILTINGGVGDTVVLNGGENIKELNIINCNLRNLHVFSLKKLEKVNLHNNDLNSPGFIAYLPNLKEIDLTENELLDYGFMRNCKNIDKIYITKYFFEGWHMINKIDRHVLQLV